MSLFRSLKVSLCSSRPLSLLPSIRSQTALTTKAIANLSIQNSQRRTFHRNAPLSSAGIVQHRDTPNNNAETPFDFTPESYKKIDEILSHFPSNYKSSGILPLLTLAQEQNSNFLTLSAMNKVAAVLNVPPMKVYEVATFYSMYNRTPVGKYHIQLCGTTPCMLCGSEDLISAIEKHLGIKSGETTSDGMFTLQEVECLGACSNAPMIQVNNHEFYENLTPESMIALIEKWKRGEKVEPGPQNGQQYAAGIQGKTSLFENPESVVCRDLDALKLKIKEDADKAAAEKAQKEAAQKAAAAPTTPPNPPTAAADKAPEKKS